MIDQTSREILLRTAAKLFRQKGYHGVGIAEILAVSGLPKGSLYHHFPGGKRELAEAATLWTGGMIEKVINRAFEDARTFDDGAAALCRGIAGLIGPNEQIQACPVASILQASVQEPDLRNAAHRVLANWTTNLARHAKRLYHPAPNEIADLVLMQLEGAWLLAVAEQSTRPFERIAAAYWSARRHEPKQRQSRSRR